MANLRQLLLLTIVLVQASILLTINFRSNEYIKLSAEKKKNLLWSACSAEQKPYGWWSAFNLARIFFEDMKPSFDNVYDVMPDDDRNKYIHSVGTVGKFVIESEPDQPFTGIFKGCKHVIGRLSVAKEPSTSNSTKKTPNGAVGNFTPGMAIKCLRDGIKSANIIVMYSVEGQPSWNFFEKDFTNHIPEKISDFALKALAKKFAQATPFVSTLGTRDFATYDESGKKVDPVLPFSLVFKPRAEVKKLFPTEFKQDYLEQLKSIEPNTVLYDIYGNKGPKTELIKIGQLRLVDEKMITSKFGDKDLFFQHSYWDDDINLHPDWEKARADLNEAFKDFHH